MESTDGTYHSYTFLIERTIKTDSIENLVLSLQPDGNYKTLIVTYHTTAQEKLDIENGFLVNLENKISKYEITDTGLISNIFNKTVVCLEIVYAYCYYGNHQDGYLPDGTDCPGYTEDTIATIGDCGSSGGSDTGEPGNPGPENMPPNNNNGGSSNNGGVGNATPITVNRPEWEKVKNVLLGNRPISDLGCE
ncbi:hypothetical protein ACFSQP_07365 [Bizionia sediminis]|uniref:Collagen-like protein n=1 Tax=Bizionia sediminis TaxID=1737064 RepID=A0ABW5KUN2_9FLAO